METENGAAYFFRPYLRSNSLIGVGPFCAEFDFPVKDRHNFGKNRDE